MSEPAAVKAIDEKFCSECGSVIKVKAEICPKCGVRQISPAAAINLGPVASNGKSRIAAALFAFFLGGIGGHKFYLGKVGLGILYLLFCWTFIPSIVGFIEFILFLTMSDAAFNQKYGQTEVMNMKQVGTIVSLTGFVMWLGIPILTSDSALRGFGQKIGYIGFVLFIIGIVIYYSDKGGKAQEK